MVKAIMHGCSGKMGQVITGLIAEEKEITIDTWVVSLQI